MQSSNEITENLKNNWELIKSRIRNDLGMTDISYNTWIDPLTVHGIDGNVVTVVIHSENDFTKTYLVKNYEKFFTFYIAEFLGDNVEVSFVLSKDIINNEETPEKVVEEIEESKDTSNSSHSQDNLNPKYVFDTFVVGNNNRLAYSAALAVAENPGQSYNPLFLYGGPGLGKTHLMHSIGHYILEHNPNMKVLYVTCETFTNEVIESIRSGNSSSINEMRNKYRTVDVLMVDDVQFIIGKESTQEEFFHTFNVLYEANKQIILSSDKPPKEMQALDERFRSRFEMGLIVDIQSPDYETKVAILQKYSENFGRSISNSILEYVASNIHSNIRELEGALNKIIAYSKINKIDFEEITVEHAEEALKDMISSSNSKVINENLILNVVAEHFNVSTQQILSSKRTQEFAEARQVVMYLCNELTNTTYQNIAKLLGKKDHTTVLHGIKKVKTRMETDEEFNNKINIITSILSPN